MSFLLTSFCSCSLVSPPLSFLPRICAPEIGTAQSGAVAPQGSQHRLKYEYFFSAEHFPCPCLCTTGTGTCSFSFDFEDYIYLRTDLIYKISECPLFYQGLQSHSWHSCELGIGTGDGDVQITNMKMLLLEPCNPPAPAGLPILQGAM